MSVLADPFMEGQPVKRPGDFRRSAKGTPYVSDPSGALTKPKSKRDVPRVKLIAVRRPSSFGKQVENLYNLEKWSERMVALGFGVDPALVADAVALLEMERDTREWRAAADKVVVKAKGVAKAGLAADRGTHIHAVTEDDDEGRDIITRIEHGEALGLDEAMQRGLLQAWRDMLDRNSIEILATEATVVNDEYRAAGTIDRMGRLGKPLRFALCSGEIVTLPAGWVGIVDIKTGQRRLDDQGVVMYWQSYAVQVALYAGSVMYDTDADTRSPMPWLVDQRWALIAHLDVLGALDGTPSCELVLVDIRAGRRAADLCVAARDWESRTDIFSVSQLDVPVEGVTGFDPVAVECDDPSTGATTVAVVDGGAVAATPDVPGEVSASRLAPSSGTPDVAAGDETPSPAAITVPLPPGDVLIFNFEGREVGRRVHNPAVNDLLPRQGMPQHAIDELAVDAEQGRRAASYEGWTVGPKFAAQLNANPDQGAPVDEVTFAAVKAHYGRLDPAAKAWIGELIGQATRHHVTFHAREVRSVRTFEAYRSVITLAASGNDNDDVLRMLMVPIVGEIALFAGLETGHILGSLDWQQMARLAALVDEYNTDPDAEVPA